MVEQQTPPDGSEDPWDAQAVLARFGANEIIADGSILYPGKEKPALYPFREDRTYGIVLDIQLSKDPIDAMSRIIVEEHVGVTANVLRSYGFGASSVHYNLIVAITEKYHYHLTLAVSIVGSPEDFWFNVQYNIVRRPIP